MESKQNPNNLVLEDRYELTEIIGEGGMAVVYKALDRRLNRYVAVKIMRPEMAQQEEFRQQQASAPGFLVSLLPGKADKIPRPLFPVIEDIFEKIKTETNGRRFGNLYDDPENEKIAYYEDDVCGMGV